LLRGYRGSAVERIRPQPDEAFNTIRQQAVIQLRAQSSQPLSNDRSTSRELRDQQLLYVRVNVM
jgi:hypothetical protein